MRRRPALPTLAQARPWLVALGLSGLLHGTLLLGRPPAAVRPSAAPALQTRSVVLPPTVAAAVAPAPLSPAVSRQARPPRPSPAPAKAEPAPAALLPAAADIGYRLRQNGQEGSARLRWQPVDNAGSYQLSLDRDLDGRVLPTLRSEGDTGAQGLTPRRFAQQRGGRDARATNFRRDEGVISFSASTEQVALADGVQDRLSGWLQVAALVAAAPQRYPAGSELRLAVVGLRGEARDWVFEVVGPESVTLADGSSTVPAALHLRRAALGVYDGGLSLWLDPARGYLPVRVLSGSLDERGWELLLRIAE